MGYPICRKIGHCNKGITIPHQLYLKQKGADFLDTFP